MGNKPTKKEIKALEAQIKQDQIKLVRENERRMRINVGFRDAIKKMGNTKPRKGKK